MLSAERRLHILGTLQREGKVVSSELSATLGVSEDTIRRDLREMGQAGLLHRVHGGALPRSPTNPSYTARQRLAPPAKTAIAQAAARLVLAGQVVIVDGGTTTLQVAQHLPLDLRATIITNSPPVAIALAGHPGLDVVVIGGRLFKDSLVAIGAATVTALQSIRADLYIMGVAGLHPDLGIGVLDLEEAQVKRTMIAGASEVMAVASAEKLGTATPYLVGPASDLTYLVTESGVPDEMLAPYRALGITVVQG